MRLSEAIRKGCEGTVQISRAWDDGNCGVCALGAAFRAIGKRLNENLIFSTLGGQDAYQARETVFNGILNKKMVHPLIDNYVTELWKIISGLNGCPATNVNNWTREAIADWVESIENSLEPNATLVTKVVEEPSLELASN